MKNISRGNIDKSNLKKLDSYNMISIENKILKNLLDII